MAQPSYRRHWSQVRSDKMVEKVLAVSRAELFPPGESPPNGFRAGGVDRYLERIEGRSLFVDRDRAENDVRLKQIIPYGLLRRGGDVFLMRRTRGGGERRLHDLFTLGVGGHINPEDAARDGRSAAAGLIERAFLRELEEELHIGASFSPSVAGVLNDESNAVGRVHFGIVYILSLETAAVTVRERTQLEGSWVPVSSLGRYLGGMETWSRFLAEHLWPESAATGGESAAARESRS